MQGLRINDLITKFGSITVENFTGLKAVGDLVSNSKGVRLIMITVSFQNYSHAKFK